MGSRYVDTVEEFESLCLKDGGRTDIELLDASLRERAVGVEERFEELKRYLSSAVPDEALPWVQSLRLEWVANEAINAVAIVGARHAFIGLYVGVLDRLWKLCLAVAAHPLYFQDFPPVIDDESDIPLLSWSDMIVDLFRGKPTPRSESALVRIASSQSDRTVAAEALYTAAVDFLVMHEIHHFWCGHLFWSRNLRHRGLAARPSGIGGAIDADLRHSLETHADQYAVLRTFEAFEDSPGLDKKLFCHAWLLGVSILFVALDPSPADIRQWPTDDYPHPHARFMDIGVAAEHAMRSIFKIDEAAWSEILGRWLRDVAYLEVWGQGRIDPPFGEALLRATEALEASKERTRVLTDSMEGLDRARLEMLEYFRTREPHS